MTQNIDCTRVKKKRKCIFVLKFRISDSVSSINCGLFLIDFNKAWQKRIKEKSIHDGLSLLQYQNGDIF